MAQRKKKTASKADTAAKKPAQRRSASQKAEETAAVHTSPHRREIAAVIFLALGVFSVIGYFPNDGWFIGFFCGLMRGLLGYGFYIFPPALLCCAWILATHRGRPVTFRVVCTLLVPLVFGALCQLLFTNGDYELEWALFKKLWTGGHTFASAGVVGGLIAVVFAKMFSSAGAGIVFVCVLVFLLLGALNQTIIGLVEKYRSRERYDPNDYADPEPILPKKERESVQRERNVSSGGVSVYTSRHQISSDIDIPIDDPIMEPEKKKSLFASTPGTRTPDEVLTGKNRAASMPPAIEEEQEEEPEPIRPMPIKAAPAPAETRPDEIKPVGPRTIHTPTAAKPAAQVQEKNDKEDKFDADAVKFEPTGAEYIFPPLDLLETDTSSGMRLDARDEMRANKDRLELTLQSFGVNSQISNVVRGPSVTRYEMELEAGVKLNKITNLADDIALSLGVSGVRIAAIPNKISTVGIEVPNRVIGKVFLRDIIDSQEFKSASSKLTFAIGKNIGGEAICGNIAKLPHMLVAGTTGSGKSVCLNSLILSILYKATPDEVKFIMVDPKMVEFKIYNGIPHLLVPVVTEAKKAAGALQWAVYEMMKRYRLFSDTGARDLQSYNAYIKSHPDEGQSIPQIVIVIDELADLMMVAAKEVEESVCRVAQMGRAAGVHLVIATQSPRADVITGLMKANIPSRIALKVSSALESRIIIDAGGNADKLVGNGDMLYVPIGASKPMRIQGTWVSDEEREKVINFVKRNGAVEYSEEVIDLIEKNASDDKQASGGAKTEAKQEAADDVDELFPQAVEVILESGQASVSMLQRRLKLGYSRAARLVDQMEDKGIVGPFEGSKPRQLLITKQQWQEMQYINGTAPVSAPTAPAWNSAQLPVQERTDPNQTMFSADDLFEDEEES